MNVATANTGTGIAIDGEAYATTGSSARGVRGLAQGDSGIGVLGINSSAATAGVPVGVRGEANSSTGIDGVFVNTGGGKILSGQAPAGTEMFSVDAAGTVKAAAFKDLAGNPIGNNITAGDGLSLATNVMSVDATVVRTAATQIITGQRRSTTRQTPSAATAEG